MSKIILKNKKYKRVSNERAKYLVTNEFWKYSNKFDWQKNGSPEFETDEVTNKEEKYNE